MAMSELKQRLLKIELAKIGLRNAEYLKEVDFIKTDKSNERMPIIYDNGDIHYGTEHENLVINQLNPIVKKVHELINAWENAAAVPIDELSNYRILSEYNNVVLAVRDDSEKYHSYGFEFVTWKYDDNRTSLEQGNYTNDYEAAKEDFAVRCGLVDRNKLFNETEMKLIRQGLVYLGSNFPDLTYEQNTLLGKVVEKIEMIVPEIQEHEKLERSELVPDDGLEI